MIGCYSVCHSLSAVCQNHLSIFGVCLCQEEEPTSHSKNKNVPYSHPGFHSSYRLGSGPSFCPDFNWEVSKMKSHGMQTHYYGNWWHYLNHGSSSCGWNSGQISSGKDSTPGQLSPSAKFGGVISRHHSWLPDSKVSPTFCDLSVCFKLPPFPFKSARVFLWLITNKTPD